jgi:uncharacterized protein YegL
MAKGLRMSTMVKIATVQDVEGLELSKDAQEEGDHYKITLDAFVTGEFKYEDIHTTVPADIVLVLDESGSMKEKFSTRLTYQYSTYKGTYNGAYNHGNLYSKAADNTYVRVQVTKTDKQAGGWFTPDTYLYTFTREGESTYFHQRRSSENTDINQWFGVNVDNLYTRSTVNTDVSKREALQEAVTQFVTDVRADNANITEGTGHRIAVVGFAGSATTRQALTLCTDTGINTAINNLGQSGATNAGAGMQQAKNILNNNPVPSGETRNRVVILFTDGEPTTGSVFNRTVANTAITQAKAIKDAGASVYTIGVFSGANANTLEAYNSSDFSSDGDLKNNKTAPTNRYMHFVSSNYPNASDLATPGSGGAKDKGFYLVAANSNDLNNIFEELSDRIESGNPAQTGLNGTNTVLKDVITPYFQLLTGVQANDVKVYTADCTGFDVGTGKYTFGAAVPFTAPDAVSINGNTVEVSKFNYSDSGNFVAIKEDGTPVGKKLIVEILVKPIDGFFGGNQVPTNTDASGLYKDNTPLEMFPVPDVDVPLYYTVSSKDQTIYLGNTANVAEMIDWEALPSPEPDGIKNAFVNLHFTVNGVSYTVPYTATGYLALDGTVSPADCTTYPISYQVESKYPGGDYDSTELATVNATVHVLKPTINTQDAWSDYNSTVDLAQCVIGTGDGNDRIATVTWSDFNGHSGTSNAIGAAPVLKPADFTYSRMDGTWGGGTNFTATEEAKFQVSKLKITGTDYESQHFKFGGNGNDFTIHLNRFDFTLEKHVQGNTTTYPQDFIFEVQYGDETYPISFGSNGGTKVIKGLLYGKGTAITATEKESWSWRYAKSSSKNSVDVPANAVAYGAAPTLTAPEPITFTNTLTNDKWLSGSARVDNHYGRTQ